jgi:hypothetical protein
MVPAQTTLSLEATETQIALELPGRKVLTITP